MRHLGLFEGIGGFSLAARWLDWRTVAWCEINPFCQKVLKYHFPNATPHEDITNTDFTIYRGHIDIITGGFPCQPFSSAGKRKGIADDRHLWPEMLRAIREVQPTWVVGENVSGILNWDGGMVFDQVHTDLETEGYEVQAFVLPACGVNAPHRRDRVWFIAHTTRSNDRGDKRELSEKECRKELHEVSALKESSDRLYTEGASSHSEMRVRRSLCRHETSKRRKGKEYNEPCDDGGRRAITDADDVGHQRFKETPDRKQSTHRNTWNQFPTQSPICNGDDGISSGLDGITFSKWRTAAIAGGGNAIVPEVAYMIFKVIDQENKN